MFWGIEPNDLPGIAAAVGTLVLLEALLSADNAIVLAVMVRHLPKIQQRRALRYGIWGAFLFRAIAVVFATYLIRYWFLKTLGGLYLIYLAIRHFIAPDPHHNPAAPAKSGSGFWATVIKVELADVAFSIDSILAAVAMAEKLPDRLQGGWLSVAIIYVGGVLGIVMMRLVAGFFLVLLDRFKGLAGGAYLLVGWIGISLLTGGLDDAFHPDAGDKVILSDWVAMAPGWARRMNWEINEYVFWGVMAAIAIASLMYRTVDPPPAAEGPKPITPEELAR